MKQRDWQARLVRIAVILGTLLVALVSIALLYIVAQVFLRFGNVVALFVVGAIVAYVLNPAVSWVTARIGKRWVGTLVAYVGAAAALALLAILVVQPLAAESSSLIRALHNPSSGSVQALTRIANRSHQVGIELRAQRSLANGKLGIPPEQVQRVRAAIAGIQDKLATIGTPPVHDQAQRAAGRHGAIPAPQIRVPPSYLAPLQHSSAALASDYEQAVHHPAAPALHALTRSIADADRVTSQAKAIHTTLSTTPIFLLDAQTWADQRHIRVHVTQSAGQAVRQITSQLSSLLNNTAAILSQTASLLLDLVLILIISVYFVVDGERMVHGAIALVPSAYHRQATFFVTSLDSILGGYIRAQIVLALVAGALAGVGAAVLGVPFALVIGVSTFALQLLPVIGPLLVYIPPMVIALLFTSMPTSAILLGYLVVMEQVVTNVVGPRVNSRSVGIHPLEAMAAALLAYPIGGILGSFLAVPLVGLIHVIAREAYTSRRAGNAPSGAPSASGDLTKDESSAPAAESASAIPTSRDGKAEQEPMPPPGTSRRSSEGDVAATSSGSAAQS